MIVADLAPEELRHWLRRGLPLRTGPVVSCITSSLPLIERGVRLLYAGHELDRSGFSDFHVRIALSQGIRRWLQPQVFFHFDGTIPFNPLPADQAFPILEWGLNWCLSSHCHRYLTLHAAVVERGGRAMILPAPPGSGKSTLCAGLIHSGWRLLSDELAMIDPETKTLTPVPRPVSLKNDSIDVIRDFAPAAVLGPTVSETVKGRVAHMLPPEDALRRHQESVPPGWVVIPRYVPDAPPVLARLPKARALMHLAENAFNYNVHGRRGFDLLSDVVSKADCYSFSYSRLEDAAEILARLSAGSGPAE